MTQRLLLILGPHRSGTSLLANALTCIVDAALPPGANWTGPDNPAGFAESPELIALNDIILRTVRRTWDNPEPLPEGFEQHPALKHGLFWDASAVLRALVGNNKITVLKDPRLCRTLPFWARVFEAAEYEVMAVRALRHPMESAASLRKRNGLSIERGLQLWLEHVLCCRKRIPAEWRQASVLFERMMCLPRYAVERVASELRLQVNGDALSDFCRNFLRPDLRHELAEGADDELLPAEVRAVWELERNRAGKGAGAA